MAIKLMWAPAGRDGFKASNCLLTPKEFLSPKDQKETNNDDEHNSSTTLDLTYKIYFIHSKVNDYAAAVNALNAYFAPEVNSAYARHTFRQLQ